MSAQGGNEAEPRLRMKKKKKRSSTTGKRGKTPFAREKHQQIINKSATKIQAGFRGHLSRQRIVGVKLEREKETAVVAIQKGARGYLSRKRVDNIRENRRMQMREMAQSRRSKRMQEAI